MCTPENGSVRLGLQLIKDVGAESATLIVEERESCGPYATAGDLVRRTGLKPQAVLSLTMAGRFRRRHPEPQGGPVGGGAARSLLAERPGRTAHIDAG